MSQYTVEISQSQDHISRILDDAREGAESTLRMVANSSSILSKLSESVLSKCILSTSWLQMSGLTREEVKSTLSILHAGRWEKMPCQEAGFIDYEGEVDGVRIVLYRAQPPPSCRIETEHVYVPAHNKTVRKLICA